MGIIKDKITKDIRAQRSQGLVKSSKIDQAFARNMTSTSMRMR